MTITAMAKQLNVSTMTIYRRCQKKGINLADLRDDENGELTSEGVATIAALFDKTTPQMAPTGATQPPQPTSGGDLAVQVAALTATVDGLRLLVEQLTGERDELRRQVAALTAALEREQLTATRLLNGGDGNDDKQPGQPRRRWWPPWARD